MSRSIVARAEFQELAEQRLAEAKVLLDQGQWDGAYYLAGYAVELGLKACIIKSLLVTDAFPAKDFSKKCYTHAVGSLVGLASLDESLRIATSSDLRPTGELGTDAGLVGAEAVPQDRPDRGRSPLRSYRRRCTWSTPVDQDAGVREQFDSGERLREALVADGFDIRVAFWAKPTDDGKWFLYLASPEWMTRGGRRPPIASFMASCERCPTFGSTR